MWSRSCLVVVALGITLAPAGSHAAPPVPVMLRRLTNIHGTACQVFDAETQHAQYQDTGMTIKMTSTPLVSVACPVPWSQDQSPTSLPTQKITVSLEWTSAPVGGGFSPSCVFYKQTNNAGGIWYGPPVINNPGTPTPEYVLTAAATTILPLPVYGTITGSALYCTGVPAGVGISSYMVETCFWNSILGC